MELTDEQREIVHHHPAPHQRILVNAYAGTGKTTTCRAIIERHGAQMRFDGSLYPRAPGGAGLRFLYLVFNRSVQKDAERRLSDLEHCDCRTSHSIAYRFAFGHCKGFRTQMALYATTHPETKTLLQEFFLSSEPELPSGGPPSVEEARALWLQIASGKRPFTHDAYLKYFTLHPKAPKWLSKSYDAIIVDEAQDISEVMMDFLMKLPQPLYFVGDQHQSIYAFRNTKNALARIPHMLYNNEALFSFALTQSFRFGNTIASVANRILLAFGLDEGCLRGTSAEGFLLRADAFSKEELFESCRAHPWSVIGRTNAQVFMCACEASALGLRIHFVSHENTSPVIDSISAAIRKYAPRGRVNATRLQRELDRAKANDDTELCMILQLIKRTDVHELECMIANVKQHNVTRAQANLVLGTVHGNKGLEWERVFLLDDFVPLGKLWSDARGVQVAHGGKGSASGAQNPAEIADEVAFIHEEVHLYYVAVTRAIHTLRVNRGLDTLWK